MTRQRRPEAGRAGPRAKPDRERTPEREKRKPEREAKARSRPPPRGRSQGSSTKRPGTRPAPVVETEPVRLQKWLAECGVGSRRDVDRWIEAGRVRVDGVIARPGIRVSGSERIEVDGRRIERKAFTSSRVLLLNKAEGVVCTRRDPEGRPTCFAGLPRLAAGRWISVGRLDIGTSGLLLITNDGALAHRLVLPSLGIDREYTVRVDRLLDSGVERVLRDGVLFDDGSIARFTDIAHRAGSGHNHWYQVVLVEGGNRDLRRLFESQDIRISRVKQVRFGPVLLPSSLKRGQSMELDPRDTAALYSLVHLPVPPHLATDTGSKKTPSVMIPYPELPVPQPVPREQHTGSTRR